MKPFRISTMCQLVEIVCHARQFANGVCLLYGQPFYDVSFPKNFSYKLAHGYSCVLGFAFERVVILCGEFYRDAVFLLFGCTFGRATRPPLFYSDLVISVSLICFDGDRRDNPLYRVAGGGASCFECLNAYCVPQNTTCSVPVNRKFSLKVKF